MKKIIIPAIALTLVILPLNVSATSPSSSQQQGQTTSQPIPQTSGENGNDQNREETQTNNPETGIMTQEQARTELQTQLKESQSSYTPEGQANQTRLNAVYRAVQNMLTIASRVATQNASLSDKIQTTAQSQIQTQDKINQSLDKAESRSGFAKFFVGPNYKELKTVKQEMEQNQLRIQELNQIVSQITNQSDQTELKNQIKILEIQNTALNEQLDKDVQGFSLFGWLSRLINNY